MSDVMCKGWVCCGRLYEYASDVMCKGWVCCGRLYEYALDVMCKGWVKECVARGKGSVLSVRL